MFESGRKRLTKVVDRLDVLLASWSTVAVGHRSQDGVAGRIRSQIGRDVAWMRNRRAAGACSSGRCDRFVPGRGHEFDRVHSVFGPPDARTTFVDGAGQLMRPPAAIDAATDTLERRR